MTSSQMLDRCSIRCSCWKRENWSWTNSSPVWTRQHCYLLQTEGQLTRQLPVAPVITHLKHLIPVCSPWVSLRIYHHFPIIFLPELWTLCTLPGCVRKWDDADKNRADDTIKSRCAENTVFVQLHVLSMWKIARKHKVYDVFSCWQPVVFAIRS